MVGWFTGGEADLLHGLNTAWAVNIPGTTYAALLLLPYERHFWVSGYRCASWGSGGRRAQGAGRHAHLPAVLSGTAVVGYPIRGIILVLSALMPQCSGSSSVVVQQYSYSSVKYVNTAVLRVRYHTHWSDLRSSRLSTAVSCRGG